jgi:hypothetical protein
VGFGCWCAVVDSSSAKELGYVVLILKTCHFFFVLQNGGATALFISWHLDYLEMLFLLTLQ